MKLLLKNILTADPTAKDNTRRVSVAVDGEYIASVTQNVPEGNFDRVIDGTDLLLTPGFYNIHTHSAMTLFRGLGGGLSLQSWLNDKIFPAEDRLTNDLVRTASRMAIAEMLACGTVSMSDMYYFCEAFAEVVAETGFKANISRSVVSFDENADPAHDYRVREGIGLVERWNNVGRIKADFSLHAEYTNTPRMCAYLAEQAAKYEAGMQIHLSETKDEHDKCVAKYLKTPTAFFDDLGVLTDRTTCAHGVHLTDEDMAILAERGSTVAHCPRSNLKLGSGTARLAKMLDSGVNVGLGTDGAASNNRLSTLGEYNLAAILHNGANYQADLVKPADLLPLIAENGARSQGRYDCGRIAPGMKADLAAWKTDTTHTYPILDAADLIAYSLDSSDAYLTMVDGDILYENGEYTTIDAERMRYDFKKTVDNFYEEAEA